MLHDNKRKAPRPPARFARRSFFYVCPPSRAAQYARRDFPTRRHTAGAQCDARADRGGELPAKRIRARQMAPRWTRLRAPPIAAARLPRAKRDKLPIISSYRQASRCGAMPADKNANIIGSYQLAKPAAVFARPMTLILLRGRSAPAISFCVVPRGRRATRRARCRYATRAHGHIPAASMPQDGAPRRAFLRAHPARAVREAYQTRIFTSALRSRARASKSQRKKRAVILAPSLYCSRAA